MTHDAYTKSLQVQSITASTSNCISPPSSRAAVSELGLVSRASPVHTTMRNCTKDEGGPFGVGNQVSISSRRKPLSSKAMVVILGRFSDLIGCVDVLRVESP